MNLDAVPYMTTLGGQTFAQAFGQMYQQMVFNGVQPAQRHCPAVHRNALGGADPLTAQGFASCTAALASKNTTLIQNTRRVRPLERHE